MRHKKKHGIAYSVFPFGSSTQMFLTGEPEKHSADPNDYSRQIRSLLEQCRSVCQKEGFLKNVAMMSNFFLDNIGMRELVRQLAHEVFPEILGTLTLVPQAPASGARVALELWAVTGEESQVQCYQDDSDFFGSATAVFNKMRWFFSGGCKPDTEFIGAYSRSKDAFVELELLLNEEDFRLTQILRTWIYQGHLLMPEGKTQRYKELNRARTDYFEKKRFLKNYLPKDFKGVSYPASTGIGADDYDVVISGVALDTKRKDVVVVPLENPNQTAAFDYGSEYSPQSPKFSRAMAAAADNTCLIFVSGTASITDSESQHHEDVVKQTKQTLDNIAVLIAGENLAQHGIAGMVCGLGNLESVHVYVKRRSELELVRQVCEKRLPEVPTLYTIADVCRPELLVEIEGIAVTQR